MRLFFATLIVATLTGCATSPNKPGMTACHRASTQEVSGLFDQWNAALKTDRPETVAARYSQDSVLLPTLSNTPRLTAAAKVDYFQHFLEKRPVGTIDQRHIFIECNAAIDTGLYTFAFNDGSAAKARYTFTYHWDGQKWLITTHHSSLMPESH
ncbi:MAG: protein kinase [Burkholderiaceae bacterium]